MRGTSLCLAVLCVLSVAQPTSQNAISTWFSTMQAGFNYISNSLSTLKSGLFSQRDRVTKAVADIAKNEGNIRKLDARVTHLGSVRLHCPARWSMNNAKCYQFTQCKNNAECYADNARTLCSAKQASLASVRLEADNSFIAGLAPAHIHDIFIGGRDDVTEGVWQWPDGSRAGYTRWNTAQPDNCCGGQHCLLMMRWSKRGNTWDDVVCSQKYRHSTVGYVCEKPAGVTFT